MFGIPHASFPEVHATFPITAGVSEKRRVEKDTVLDKRNDTNVYSLVKSGQIPSSEEVEPRGAICLRVRVKIIMCISNFIRTRISIP